MLGARIGEESANARVFRLVNPDIPGCKPGCLIKTLRPGDVQVMLDTVSGGNLVIDKLGDAILQPKLIAYDALAPRPYMIVEELVPVPGELEG